MDSKKPESPERDSQLWIHQDGKIPRTPLGLKVADSRTRVLLGFLTNKASGLVLDINPAESFMGKKRKHACMHMYR